jgi:Virulence-associated protein E/VirE N-terminal domain/Primase C terminal 2 (PriCT-2)
MQKYTFSFYKTIKDTKPKEIDLTELIATIKGNKLIAELTATLRLKSTKKARTVFKIENFKAVTVSGVCKGIHSAKNLVRHNGLIQIDFDEVSDLKKLRLALMGDQYTFIMFTSPSGNGLKLFVKIDADKEKHLLFFIFLKQYYFDLTGLQIDSQCSDVGRLCFISHDKNIFVNEKALQVLIVPGTTKKIEPGANKIPSVIIEKSNLPSALVVNDKVLNDVENVLQQIAVLKIDITAAYEKWIKIGFALAATFGENGREYFHKVSCYNLAYNVTECNIQFDKCLQDKGTNKTTIAAFFGIAKENGLDISPKKNNFQPLVKQPIVENKKEVAKVQVANEPKVKSVSKKIIDSDAPLIVKVENFLTELYEFRFNEILRQPEMKERSGGGVWEVANENTLTIQLMQHHFKVSVALVKTFLGSYLIEKFHPFINYFESLPTHNPKAVSEIDKLSTYVKAVETERFTKHFKKMFVRSVACAVWNKSGNNEHFNKQVFTLVQSAQNGGKSSFLRWLCPKELENYYSEDIELNKDGEISLCNTFIINLDELANLGKKDIDCVKGHISKSMVTRRFPFDSRPTTNPRRTNFVASTNNTEFLQDTTGSVRFLCFEIEKIDWNYKKDIDINKVWAEAFYLFNTGFKFQLTKEEVAENEVSNEQFTIQTAEEEFLKKRFYVEQDSLSDSCVFLTTADVVNKFKVATNGNFNTSEMRMGKFIRKLGFLRIAKRSEEHGNFAVYGYCFGVNANFKENI